MINIQAYSNRFKFARRKQYDAYFCKVPVGSCILDKVKDAKAISLLGGRDYLSNIEVSEIKRQHPEIYKLICSNLAKSMDFVLSIDNNLSLITFADLVRDYVYADKKPITKQSVLDKAYISEWYLGQLTPVKVTYNHAIKADKNNPQNLEENIVVKWQKVCYGGSKQEVALPCVDDIRDNFRVYLPNPEDQYFIVCDVVDNQIAYNTGRFITSGEFAYKYDLRGWSELIKEEVAQGVSQPKELFELSSRLDTKASFSTIIYDFLRKSYKGSFAEGCNIISDLEVTRLTDYCVSVKYTQHYGEMKVNYLIYTRGNEYFIAQGDVDAKFDDDLKKYILSLEKQDKVVVKLSDLQKFKEILVAILGFTPMSNVSNYFIPRLTLNEYESLKSYSGSAYHGINKYLRGEECDNPFEAYLQATFISDVIERTLISKDIYHFRGISLPNRIADKVKEGYVLENKCFASTALVSPVAMSFGLSYDTTMEQGFVLVFKNSFRQHGVYINNFSVHKNTEFEVLYNIGYDFKCIKKLGHFSDEYGKCAVWLCEIIEDTNRGIRRYAYKKDATEKLVYMIQSDARLMKNFYIRSVEESERNCRVVLKQYNVDNYYVRICLEGDEFIVNFTGDINEEIIFSIKEKGYQFLFQYIYHVLNKDSNFKPCMSTSSVATFSERFMQDLCSLFIQNNFIISKQDVNKEWQKNGKMLSTFSILDSELKPIDFEVVVSNDADCIRLELGVESRRKVFKKPIDKRFEFFEEVYWAIVRKFDLDSTRRIKRIFAVLGGFHECDVEFYRQEDGTYKCYMGNRVFNIGISGTSVIVGLNSNSVTLDYYEDIYEAVSDIKTLM